MSKGISKLMGSRRFQKLPEGYKMAEELEVEAGDVLDTNVGPIVVIDTDEDTETLVVANTEDDTLIISAEEFASIDPVEIELSPEEVFDLVADETEDSEEEEEEEEEGRRRRKKKRNKSLCKNREVKGAIKLAP